MMGATRANTCDDNSCDYECGCYSLVQFKPNDYPMGPEKFATNRVVHAALDEVFCYEKMV